MRRCDGVLVYTSRRYVHFQAFSRHVARYILPVLLNLSEKNADLLADLRVSPDDS